MEWCSVLKKINFKIAPCQPNSATQLRGRWPDASCSTVNHSTGVLGKAKLFFSCLNGSGQRFGPLAQPTSCSSFRHCYLGWNSSDAPPIKQDTFCEYMTSSPLDCCLFARAPSLSYQGSILSFFQLAIFGGISWFSGISLGHHHPKTFRIALKATRG